jgi:hypothetical protein
MHLHYCCEIRGVHSSVVEDTVLLGCYSLLAEYFFVGCLVLKMKSPQSFKLSGTIQHQYASVCQSQKIEVMACQDVTICTNILEESAASVFRKQVSHLGRPQS